ncbi:hypothetical protein ABZ619_39750 [Streptomyces sp. NPDC007851]|uniref:hypothetical protein n=1 Tax=Streptomyces sp. NPDC007851 TaxID=3155008 RepID=UPI0033E09399
MDPTRILQLAAAVVLAAAGTWLLLRARPRRPAASDRTGRTVRTLRATLVLAICSAISVMAFGATAHADDASCPSSTVVSPLGVGMTTTASCPSTPSVGTNISDPFSSSSLTNNSQQAQEPLPFTPQFTTTTSQNSDSTDNTQQNFLPGINQAITGAIQGAAVGAVSNAINSADRNSQNNTTATTDTSTTTTVTPQQEDTTTVTPQQQDTTTVTPQQQDTTTVDDGTATNIPVDKKAAPQDETAAQQCQLTEAQKQELVQRALEEQAAGEQAFQQHLLKNLLQQAAMKADSAALQQQLSGHTGLSPQDVAELLKNGLLTPDDLAQAVLQSLHDLGGHAEDNNGSQGADSSCEQGSQDSPTGASDRVFHSDSQDQGDETGQGTSDGQDTVTRKAKPSSALKGADDATLAKKLSDIVDQIKAKLSEKGNPRTTIGIMLVKDKSGKVALVAALRGWSNSDGYTEGMALKDVRAIIDDWNTEHAGEGLGINFLDQKAWHESAAKLETGDAEQFMIRWATYKNYEPLYVGATRNICTNCFEASARAGVIPVNDFETPKGPKSDVVDPLADFQDEQGTLQFDAATAQKLRDALKTIVDTPKWRNVYTSDVVRKILQAIAEGKDPEFPSSG